MKVAVIVPFMLLMATACFDLAEASRDEVARVSSPSGKVDAVVVETNGGATTSFGYEVHVVRKTDSPTAGSEAAFIYGAGRNEHAFGVNLRWRSDDVLVVEYLDAKRVVRLRSQVTAMDHHVTISLVSGVRDTTAPAGGMHYNLQRPREQ
jgi:hypothetical protein